MNRILTFLLLASACLPLRALAADDKLVSEFPQVVRFELGDAEFAPSDHITIEAVRGTRPVFEVGQTYCVTGTYTLSSKPEAELALFVTTTNPVPRSWNHRSC